MILKPSHFIYRRTATARYLVILFLFSLGIYIHFTPSFAVAESHRHHEAHEHGAAQLNIVVEGHALNIEFISPAANITGFEYLPTTHKEKTAYKDAVKRLKSGQTLFTFPGDAACTLKYSKVITDRDDSHHHDNGHHDEDNHMTKDEHASTHSDFRCEYHFEVGQPSKLTSIQVELIKLFPSIDHIAVQVITPVKQSAMKLTSKSTRIKLQ